MVVNISVELANIYQTGFKLRGGHDFMTKITIFNVQRAIIPQEGKPQLWFLCSARRHMVVNLSVKFRQLSRNDVYIPCVFRITKCANSSEKVSSNMRRMHIFSSYCACAKSLHLYIL